MSYKDLREYISALEAHGEVQRIGMEVNWNLEAGAILRRTYERGLPAPFFEKVTGYPEGYTMFGGALSSIKRLALALGMDPASTYKDIMEEYLKRKDKLVKPRVVKTGPCKENIHLGKDVDLFEFPAPMLHEGDGGRYLCTWHLNITKDPDTGWVNWGMYRAMINSKNSLTGMIEPQKHAGMHLYRRYEPKNQSMPFAIAIAPEPVSTLTAATGIPYGVAEADVTGALRKEALDVVKCETVDLYVPATSEIVIEGQVNPQEKVWEGPFGEYTGYRASPRDKRPLYRVTAVTHRNKPILGMSCMGVPVDDAHIAMAITGGAEILAELRRKGMPVTGLKVYPECAVQLVVASIKPTESNVAQIVSHVIFSTPLGRLLPYCIIVEDDVDPGDMAQVLHALTTKCHPWRGITRLEHTVGTALTPFENRHERLNRQGSKVYFDCTWPLDWDPSIAVPPRASFDNIYSKEVQEHVLNNWKNYGFKEL